MESNPDTLFGIPAEAMAVSHAPYEVPQPEVKEVGVTAETSVPADEEAAMKFTKLLPYVIKLSDAMPSKGGLVRVLHALAEFPLGATKPKLLNEAERQLFHVMMELQGYKSTVVSSIMKKNMEMEQMKKTAEASTPPAESEVQNG